MPEMIVKIAISMVLSCIVNASFAKIGDPPPVIDGAVIYRSHANFVEAIDQRTQRQLWKTEVFEDSKDDIDPSLEADVQMNVISIISLRGEFIWIKSRRGQEFLLIKANGKVKAK